MVKDRKEYRREHYEKNKKHTLEVNKKWREQNKQKCTELARDWRNSNKQKAYEATKRWRSKNKDKIIAYRKRWREDNKEKIREYKRKHYHKYKQKKREKDLLVKYNLTLVAYKRLLCGQNKRCAICRKKKVLCVDHCHKSKKIRGLLCKNCNTAIGLLRDKIKWLERAIAYLIK